MKKNADRSTHADPLAALRVIDRLEVGPVQVTNKRLSAPYRVFQGQEVYDTQLIYSYDEPVFTAGDGESENLAAVIAVQAAINYGLFCKKMIFYGPYDEADRNFLRAVLDNTAKEILVNKLLTANPFILHQDTLLAAHSRGDVLGAPRILPGCLEFAGPDAVQARPWPGRRDKYCVLSSGGKDSLLSYGLLAEMGVETMPVFVNESGRHWYTALNAYRYFREHVANTRRVWTNADRLFAWMLRRIPFITPRFLAKRADEYPLRLWTVAVFLFGALPLCRKYGLGRLVIGDEFDTSQRIPFGQVMHYNGLYDQSIFFDHALSRYYSRKNWCIEQFSLLRQMSEMLIQKTLYERYPDLQRLQVSCHMTHIEKDQVKPCGACEKCCRVVGMLLAIGADPRRCGYTDAQILHCLKWLEKRDVHQERAGREHLLYELLREGILDARRVAPDRVQSYPEILKLRFHPLCSPAAGLPADIRRSLFTILLRYARGSVARHGSDWLEFDLLSDPMVSCNTHTVERDRDNEWLTKPQSVGCPEPMKPIAV